MTDINRTIQEVAIWLVAGTPATITLFVSGATIIGVDPIRAGAWSIILFGIFISIFVLTRLVQLTHSYEVERIATAEESARAAIRNLPRPLVRHPATGQRVVLLPPEPEEPTHFIITRDDSPVHRFIEYGVLENNTTREHLCTNRRVLTQRQWKETREELIARGILDKNGEPAIPHTAIKLTDLEPVTS